MSRMGCRAHLLVALMACEHAWRQAVLHTAIGGCTISACTKCCICSLRDHATQALVRSIVPDPAL